MSNNGKRVIVAMSGGVDSSVAALLVCEQGFDVEGLFMFNWDEDEQGYCDAAADYQDARRVCEQLHIPLHRADFSAGYRDRVFRHFIDQYAAGRTPNPDILCNREIKFGAFLDHARRLGADLIATGHYAGVESGDDGPHLMRARDHDKDQTYFLAGVDQAAFNHVVFPLAELPKTEVRKLAEETGFGNFDKRDSTGICFIGERPFNEFLGHYLRARPGPIRDVDSGARLGEHTGIMFYTLGQRRGLGVGGLATADDAPWYVVDKTPTDRTLWVSQNASHPRLMSVSLISNDMHWIGTPPSSPLRCHVRIRHRQPLQSCRVSKLDNGAIKVEFDQPQRAATPGQFAVLYAAARCLGGGVIETRKTLDTVGQHGNCP